MTNTLIGDVYCWQLLPLTGAVCFKAEAQNTFQGLKALPFHPPTPPAYNNELPHNQQRLRPSKKWTQLKVLHIFDCGIQHREPGA